MEVQVFGVRKNADTRAALRFFAERRVKVHFVDLLERAASKGELGRFAQKFGALALLDRTRVALPSWDCRVRCILRNGGSTGWRTSRCCFGCRWCDFNSS